MERELQNQFARRAAIAGLTVAFLVLLVIIVSSGGGGSSHAAKSASRSATTRGGAASGASARQAYVVRQGDTLSAIAQKTGVSVSQLQALNPNVDPQALHAGERVNLH